MPMLDIVKAQVHLINNKLQIVLGYIELDQCPKAVPVIKETIKEMFKLAKFVSGSITITAKETVIVAPEGVPLVHPADVKIVDGGKKLIDPPANMITLVPKAVVKPKHKRGYKPRGPKLPNN